jgi:hypothetical protein
VEKDGQPDASAASQGGGSKNKNNKKKKADGNNQPLAGAPTAAVAAAVVEGRGPRGDKRSRQASGNDNDGACCSVPNSTCHSTGECREIKKVMEQFDEKQ